MTDEAYLGAYESNQEIKVVINREILEDMMNYMEEGKQITISDAQFAVIRKEVYEAGLVSDFIESVLGVIDNAQVEHRLSELMKSEKASIIARDKQRKVSQ